MTPEEQQQVNAIRNSYLRTIGNLANENAELAGAMETLAQKLKAAQEELAKLKESNVVPIKEPA